MVNKPSSPKRPFWWLGFAVSVLLTLVWAAPLAQTLGKRKLPGSITNANVGNLPVSYAKSTFQVSISDRTTSTNEHQRGAVYIAPVLSSGPDLPARPEFQFKIVGIHTGEWKPSGNSKMEFVNEQGGRIRIEWDNRAKVLRMRLGLTIASGGSTLGPHEETFAIDITMLDHDAKQWYLTRLVQFFRATKIEP